jgi:hypothetical protein
MNLDDAEHFANQNAAKKEKVKKIILDSIKVKNPMFLKTDFEGDYAWLTEGDLVIDHVGEKFELNYSNFIVCLILLEVAEELLAEELPRNDIREALKFSHRFCDRIREPNIRHTWYHHLEINFKSFVLLFLNNKYSVDVTEPIESLTEDERRQERSLVSYEHFYRDAFPYLTNTSQELYHAAIRLHSQIFTQDNALQALRQLGEKNAKKAQEVLQLAKVNSSVVYNRFLPWLIIGLYSQDSVEMSKEAKALFVLDRQQGLFALALLPYKNPTDIQDAYEFVKSQPYVDAGYVLGLPFFYSQLIENTSTSNEIRRKCFSELAALAKTEDHLLRRTVSNFINSLQGYDEEKYAFLPQFLNWEDPNVIRDFFDRFETPTYLFRFIADMYSSFGLSTDLEIVSQSLGSQYASNRDLFENELLKMLTDDLAVVRFAGVQILLSAYGGVYSVNFLKLNQEGQSRVIESILPIPINIEEVLPLLLQLRKSPYTQIKDQLHGELKNLIRAFDHHLLEMVKKSCDENDTDDKAFMGLLEASFRDYNEEKKLRKSVNEFNPLLNELEYVQSYYRHEREYQAKLMQASGEKGIFNQLAKTVKVIRGNAFRSETNSQISVMGTISVSRLMDQRFNINPDLYEFNFKRSVYGKNYDSKSAK